MISETQTLCPGTCHWNAHQDMKRLPIAHCSGPQTWLLLEPPQEGSNNLMLRLTFYCSERPGGW